MSYHSHVPQASDMIDMRAMYQVNIPFGIESAQSSEHIMTNLREKAGQIAQNPVCAVSGQRQGHGRGLNGHRADDPRAGNQGRRQAIASCAAHMRW
tara:strand:+ start:1481 stop:1768 length:288 start_codon:yes stop_codon:yes gene_type:complete